MEYHKMESQLWWVWIFNCSIGKGFTPFNKETIIPNLGSWTNLKKNSPIPGSTLSGAKFTSSIKPCVANPSSCLSPSGENSTAYQGGWSGAYLNSAACYKYGRFDITMASQNKNSFHFIAWI